MTMLSMQSSTRLMLKLLGILHSIIQKSFDAFNTNLSIL